MTVSHGVEGQLISEAKICIYSDMKALSYCPKKIEICQVESFDCSAAARSACEAAI